MKITIQGMSYWPGRPQNQSLKPIQLILLFLITHYNHMVGPTAEDSTYFVCRTHQKIPTESINGLSSLMTSFYVRGVMQVSGGEQTLMILPRIRLRMMQYSPARQDVHTSAITARLLLDKSFLIWLVACSVGMDFIFETVNLYKS